MSSIDWLVLAITLLSIIGYGVWKSRGTRNIEGYLLADRKLPWYHVGFSVMATQASAITFLSAPGQGYTDGMRFVQFYFGLPLAMVVLCVTFVPIFHRLSVFTAYEYLEKRFDVKTRALTAFLFLLQRGLSTGITIYAPSIILSVILDIDIFYTILFNGVAVVAYTVYGGAKAVSYTQLFQMSIIFASLFLAAGLVINLLPEGVGLGDALHIAGAMNKINAIDTHFDLNNRYNIWSGLIGGFFLQLSYFGTDQSQVGRYLTGSSITQSRLGLVMNGLVKIPMQFFILLIGVLVFTFYQFTPAPLFFNRVELNNLADGPYAQELEQLKERYAQSFEKKRGEVASYVDALHSGNETAINTTKQSLGEADSESQALRKDIAALILRNNPDADTNDGNYVFLSFVTQQLPVGVVGLLIAVIFLASMGSTSSGINALASTTVVDYYRRFFRPQGDESRYLHASRWATVAWGVFCVVTALYASHLGNLIEAVNILGSLFYGTILGIFLVAFYLPRIGGTAVFFAALAAEAFIVYAWLIDLTAFLWLNMIGCALVMLFSLVLHVVGVRGKQEPETPGQ